MKLVHLKLILGFILLAAFATFVLQNNEHDAVNFLKWSFGLSRIVLIGISFTAGMITVLVIKMLTKSEEKSNEND